MMHTRNNWLVTTLLCAASLTVALPLYLTITIALKSPEQTATSALALPLDPQWDNFSRAIETTGFFRALLNSTIITIAVVVLVVLTNSLVAYAIARNMHRRLFRGLYYYLISALFIPFPIIMLPVVRQMSMIGLDNQIGLILLYVVYGLSFNVFLYTGYLRSIPRELEEAAALDGTNTWQTFWRVIFPLLTPINATVAVLTCLTTWNDFLLPLVMLGDRDSFTLPLVQYAFQGQFNTDYNLAFASYLMALAPMVILYVTAQRWIISGVMRGAIR
ncbi:carbohydrate ABC transporter permease [Allostreptomyces psammosilenae]|uniref:Raffinose/stachyose/melibiose transport system permease protein n=1 Tax=Allostreptomyces psammosilenae TaxID=1892865 RepID=A0A852ZMR7_9ACTN|nr:carbohydrate ABC transporter permease [Allostreptomyces psammosilenae]NYI03726.1 raffinose/stachyose/melibiose transport system permease protein [Allostreptomyces psammosilenae]